MTLEQRLLSHCDKTNYCWNWTGAVKATGYGYMITGSRTDGTRRTRTVHRVAHEVWLGPITDECVLHHCDNKRCINPEHLYSGSKKQNTADAKNRGRLFLNKCSSTGRFIPEPPNDR